MVSITLDYQEKSNNILDDLKKDISDLESNLSWLKSDVSTLEAYIQVSRNLNSKLSERLVTMESRCYANEQYSRREYLEIFGYSRKCCWQRPWIKTLGNFRGNWRPNRPYLGWGLSSFTLQGLAKESHYQMKSL